ncbi:presenilins-associated rhomboid-like protein, mitochondrial [Rhopalosiphum maidis]|uniref:presenilins-associated rhomboid-like protein, mitochondrial n=1 Tax=Rhopalosiphum maidis TaxID=43146 RepID=UPI000F00066C|nr:presenilins-associated rhomboid-like protein, mitochondrial [Rhopalosiphum maidis]
MKSKLGTNVQQLRRIYEPCIVGRNPSVNNLNHTTIAAIYHAMFTLTVIFIAVIFATIIEHRRMLNIYWKTLSNIKFEILDKMILKENTVLSFWKYLSNGEKAFGIITFVNVVVYLSWNVTKWNSTMFKYFIVNEDQSNSVWSNLLSSFSHSSLRSLTANVVYLYYSLCKLGFIRAWPISIFSPYMGIEEFFVFYISACLFSSLSRIYIEPKLNMFSKKSRHGAFLVHIRIENHLEQQKISNKNS